jgi:hypothetical protein
MDVFADPTDRDDVSPFVKLIWDRGQAHEGSAIADLGVPFSIWPDTNAPGIATCRNDIQAFALPKRLRSCLHPLEPSIFTLMWWSRRVADTRLFYQDTREIPRLQVA